MKRFLFAVLLVFALCPPVQGGMLQAIVGGASAAPSTACQSATKDSAGSTILLCEDFDNPSSNVCYSGATAVNCWNTWSANLGIFTTAGIEGAYSLSATTQGYKEVTASDNMYIYFLVKPTTTASTRTLIDLYSGGAERAYVYLHGTTRVLDLTHGVVTASTTGALTDNTIYYVWMGYTKGTGVNGTAYVAFSTTTTKPTVCDPGIATCGDAVSAAVVTGTSTTSVDRLYIGPFAAGGVYTYDRIRVKATDFGSNPP